MPRVEAFMRKMGFALLAVWLGCLVGGESVPAQGAGQASPFGDMALQEALAGKGAERDRAVQQALAHPEAVHPIFLAFLAEALWQRGDKRQAAFWFYIFQSRSRIWADLDPEMGQRRSALNDLLGRPINRWAASDLPAWHEIGARAITYEKKIPDFAGKLPGYSAETWAAELAKRRKEYEDGFLQAFPKTAQDRQKIDAKRQQNGLYVGPLLDPGKPLPDDWR
ncbi:hypothetical protein [Labrys neptuniae]